MNIYIKLIAYKMSRRQSFNELFDKLFKSPEKQQNKSAMDPYYEVLSKIKINSPKTFLKLLRIGLQIQK